MIRLGELSPADRAAQTRHREIIYEVIHGNAKAKGAHAANAIMGNSHDASAKLADAFTTETAGITGRSTRVIQRDAERGEEVCEPALALVGTALDTGAFIDRLKRIEAAIGMHCS